MLRRVLIQQVPVTGEVGQNDPAGTATECVAHRSKLRAPPIERAELLRDDVRDGLCRLAFAVKAREVELVQQRRVERSQRLSLEPVDDVAGRILEIERLELFGNRVETAQGAAIVVLVVALDELQRQTVEHPRTAVDLFQRILHEDLQAQVDQRRAAERRSVGRCSLGRRQCPRSRDFHRIGRGTVLEG